MIRGKPTGVVVLTERCIDLLVLTGLCGYLSIEQLARDLFLSLDRCRHRCRQLYNARYLQFTLYDSAKSTLVSCTRRGIAAVERARPEMAGRLRRAGVIKLDAVPHHLGSVDARLYAAALGAQRGVPLVRWANAGGELARELGLDVFHIVADGVAEFASATERFFVAVEIDRGTEQRSVLASKIERYAAVAAAGVLDALWIVVSAGAGRRRSIEELRDAAGLCAWARVFDHAVILARPVVEPGVTERREGGVRAEGPNTLASDRQVHEENHGV